MNETYKCAVCGKSYDTIEERSKCEAKCLAERKVYEEEMKKNKLETERKEKSNKIYEALDNVETMLKDYFSEHESLSIHKNYPYLKFLFSRTSWWI